MDKYRPAEEHNFIRAANKFLVSAFVVSSFAAYALHERLNSDQGAAALAAQVTPSAQADTAPLPLPSPTDLQSVSPRDPSTTAPAQLTQPSPAAPRQPTATPRRAPSPTPVPQQAKGQYRDGTYTGQPVDAFFGLVQVQATVRNGQLADVQFLQYPNDRRTSVRINNVAIPRLQSEAIRAQSANVNIITGATLTSEGFMESLQSALNTAKS